MFMPPIVGYASLMSNELTPKEIRDALLALCKREGVTCLFAVESGSRAWGFASPDSDYDVRFVYIRPQSDYLRIQRPRDVIEEMAPRDLDMVGWDVSKALTLLANSNPSIVEWLATPSVYYKNEQAYSVLANMAAQCFSAKALAMHYITLGEDHLAKYVANKTTIAPKRYFYALRAVLSADYVIQHNKLSPIVFEELLAESELPPHIRQIIDDLLVIKKQGGEKQEIPHIAPINDYIATRLKKLKTEADTLERPTLDRETVAEQAFRDLLALAGSPTIAR
jgi:predicted nucleotidyltransferase